MNQLMTIAQATPLTMSSQEIADLVESRHDNVRRTIERLAERGVIALPPMEEKPTAGRPAVEYVFSGEQGKRDSIIVVAQLSPEFTARLVDRWQELEAKQAPAFAIPKTLPEALRLAADLSEQNERLALERDEAVRTKAEIGSRREATAMATAAAKAKEVARLKHELGRNQQHATVVAVEKATGRKFAKNAYVALRRITREYGLQAVSVMDPRYGSVKAWPAVAWREAFGVDLSDLFPGAEAA